MIVNVVEDNNVIIVDTGVVENVIVTNPGLVGPVGPSGSSAPFSSDFTVILSGGKTFGKYSNGQVVSASGKTANEVILMAAIEYINPAFSSFSISGQSTTVEVGTIMSGSKTFTWSITTGSGVVSTLDIKDVTSGSTILANTSNDGSQAITLPLAYQLNSNGVSNSYKGTLHDTGTVTQDIDSSLFNITSRFIKFYGASSTSPLNSTDVRALASNAFQTSGNVFNLNTGASLIKFVVALPPGITISSVIDLDALNTDITSQYILTGTINVLDAGSTNRSYNIYEMNIAIPYSVTHRHQITTS